MTDQNFTTTIAVPGATPAQVYAAVNDVRGWWASNIAGDAMAVGDEFVHHVEGVHHCELRVDELVPDERVVWTVLDNTFGFVDDPSEWIGNQIRFDIASVPDGSRLTFTQVGLTPANECFEACKPAWTFYVTESLRDLITTGAGQPTDYADATVLRETQQAVGVA